jgi:hypothetical protein
MSNGTGTTWSDDPDDPPKVVDLDGWTKRLSCVEKPAATLNSSWVSLPTNITSVRIRGRDELGSVGRLVLKIPTRKLARIVKE